MMKRFRLIALPLCLLAGPVLAQEPQGASPTLTVCGQQVQAPRTQPPAGSGPVVLFIAPCFEAQGGASLIEPQTYVYYIQLKPSRPSENVWLSYDEAATKTIGEDFRRLWGTNFLDNLWVETIDYTFPNGVVGKIVSYNMEERQRVKIVEYVGSKKIEASKIDERLKDANAQVRLDTFIDPSLVRKVSGIVREMLKEKGFRDAEVTPEIKEIPGGPKLVNLTFRMDEGPQVKIRKLEFIGNRSISSRRLAKQMKENKSQWFLSFLSGRGTFQETKFDDDAAKVIEYYQDRGYIKVVVGAPEIKVVETSKDKKSRYIELRVPITEGPRYAVSSFDVAGNTVVKSEFLKPLFKINPGEYYSLKNLRKGLDKAREVYGGAGYWEFTGFPDYKFSDDANALAPAAPAALEAVTPQAPLTSKATVDVTMRLQEGLQYFVNRITFVGNTTTHDTVIRRELRLVEEGVFNTESLKYSVKRLNQLGYFKPLEGGKDVDVQKTPGETNRVDVKMKLEEQNRNQLTFGAGVSEFEGFFGQASFQTSNFLGRGESLTLSLQAGSRAQTYSLAFTEPFLFDRNITGGFNLFRNDVRYINQFTQKSQGTTLTFGFPLGGFTRMFMNYSFENVRVTEINSQYCNPSVLKSNPFLRDSLLLTSSSCAGQTTTTASELNPQTGQAIQSIVVSGNDARVISKVVPSLVHNTVDQPIFPTQGVRYTASVDLAGLGGNTNFYKPIVEGIWYWHQNVRMSLGFRAQGQYIHTFSGSRDLPIFEKLFLGGEYSVRGFDIRSIGPKDLTTGLVLGGNKSLLFNLEQNINIAGPVRAILFFDAGQVRDVGQPFAWKEDDIRIVNNSPLGLLSDGTGTPILSDPNAVVVTQSFGRRSAFKTSTGLEIRFFMPVLNVPFRLIMAYNPQREGVLDNTYQPQKAFQFRFAVGTTF